MSIGLFVSYHDSHLEDRLFPIASDDVFQQYWKPICAELGLRWIPRFQKGWMLAPQDMPHILEELGRLRRYLTCGETHMEISHQLLARIGILMRELNEAQKNGNADVFVGSPWLTQRRSAAVERRDPRFTLRVERRRAARPILAEPAVCPPVPPRSLARPPVSVFLEETRRGDHRRLLELVKIVQDLKAVLRQTLQGRAAPETESEIPSAWRTAIEDF